MLVTCDECRKKYDINLAGITAPKARFSCRKCGHLISINVPRLDKDKMNELAEDINALQQDVADGDEAAPLTETSGAAAETDDTADADKDSSPEKSGDKTRRQVGAKAAAAAATTVAAPRGKGVKIASYLFFTFLLIVLTLGGLLGYFYMKYVPALLGEQVDLRTASISQTLSSAIQEPLLVRNYLRVNKTAEAVSKLPGVAYVAVINKRGIPIAGQFGDPGRFTPDFAQEIKQKGFPKSLVSQNMITGNSETQARDIMVGGQPIHDVAVALKDAGGEVHVGLFTEDIKNAIRKTLVPLALTLLTLTLLGLIGFLILAKAISKPIRELTSTANKISIGELDIAIQPKGPEEVRTLAFSLERMRISIKAAMDRLRKTT